MTALWPAALVGSRRSFMASKTWPSTVSTPAASTNWLISSSDRPSSSWPSASGLLASLRSLTAQKTNPATDFEDERRLGHRRPPLARRDLDRGTPPVRPPRRSHRGGQRQRLRPI